MPLTAIIPEDLRNSFSIAPAATLPSVPGMPSEMFSLTIETGERVKNPPQRRNAQVARIDLPSLFNRHIKAESMGSGEEKFYLSTQVSLKGAPFMSVMGEDWSEPYFFPIKATMSAHWQSHSGHVYSVSVDASLFRKKFNNFFVFGDEASGQKASRKFSDFFYSAYQTGETATIGGKTYKVFYSYALDTSKSPVVFDHSSYGICLLYDESHDPSYHDIQAYPISFDSVKGPQPAAYSLHDGQVLYFHLAEDGRTLVISD